MLEQVLIYLNNWFIVPDGVHYGTYSIENGSITLPFLQNGQYFRICGSVFNDGLHQYPSVNLTDEEFSGIVWALAVPKAVISLAEKIAKWDEKNGEAAASPYISESFGGYSYTKSNGSDESLAGWESTFSKQLSQWRKLCEYDAIVGRRSP